MRFHTRRLVTALVLVVAAAAALAGLHAAAPPGVAEPTPSAFGTGPGDLSDWRGDMARSYGLRTALAGTFLADEMDPSRTLVIVHAPQQPPTSAEARALDGHLEAGGALWVLDPDGTYNAWLALHGVVVGPHRLIDPGADGAAVVRLESESPADDAVLSRSPAALILEDDSRWEVLLRAPGATYLDLDGNGTADRVDTPGPHAVAVTTSLASGARLTVAGDASHLGNEFHEHPDHANAQHAAWAVRESLPDGGTLVVDESHQGWTPRERLPVAAVQAVQTVRALPMWAASAVAVLVVGVAVIAARNARALHPYTQHERHDPSTPPDEGTTPDSIAQDAAWELLAERTNQPVDRLKKAGTEAAHGLADDPVLRRVLLGRAQEDDARKLLADYLARDPSRSKGVKP